MTVRKFLVAGWLSLGAGASLGFGQEAVPTVPGKLPVEVVQPSPVDTANQRTAEAIAAALGGNVKLAGYRIDVVFVDGVAELHGNVLDPAQQAIAKQTALSVAGVRDVRDHLTLVRNDVAVVQDQVPALPKDAPPLGGPNGPFPPMPGQMPGPMPGQAAPPFGPIPNNPFPSPSPMMMNHPGMMPNPQYQPPPLPPYAWPTYAPYNNYSRVAHPTQHTYNQWPFIGPMYPYPKIPLGWRRITLEWQDGSWWYGRESNSHDWWRIRYW